MLNCKPGPFPAIDISKAQIPKAHTKKNISKLEDHGIDVISVKDFGASSMSTIKYSVS